MENEINLTFLLCWILWIAIFSSISVTIDGYNKIPKPIRQLFLFEDLFEEDDYHDPLDRENEFHKYF
jgi:hypothetical protein